MDITLIGAPTEAGTPRRGCLMGPAALRTAGLAEALTALGHPTHDAGDVAPASATVSEAPNARLRHLSETAGWVRAVRTAVRGPLRDGRLPIVLGGDHSVAAGSLTGVMDVAPQTHVIWLDAHPDFHTLGTTTSGNLHGCALGLAAGL
ncbi:MAG: arginase family protein, partial [Pseudomonadota bacterium]